MSFLGLEIEEGSTADEAEVREVEAGSIGDPLKPDLREYTGELIDEVPEAVDEEAELAAMREEFQQLVREAEEKASIPLDVVFPVTCAASNEPQNIRKGVGNWEKLKGLSAVAKINKKFDRVLLVAHVAYTAESWDDGAFFSIWRNEKRLGNSSQGLQNGYCNTNRLLQSVVMTWVDRPGRPGDYEYCGMANTGGLISRFWLCPNRERRHISAITLPEHHVTITQHDGPQTVSPGGWEVVDGLQQVVHCCPGDKVLVICTVRYEPGWNGDNYRGRFTIVRDVEGLDQGHYGLQSVKSSVPAKEAIHLRRTAVMACVDDPGEGPHTYRAVSAVTSAEGPVGVLKIERERQLTCVRFRGDMVSIATPSSPTTVSSEDWTPLKDLTVTVNLARTWDRVLIIAYVDCQPSGGDYQAHYTLIRDDKKNLGDANFGLDAVYSEFIASHEYPLIMLVDQPGRAGEHTYELQARVSGEGIRSEKISTPTVISGNTGQLAAIVLPTSK